MNGWFRIRNIIDKLLSTTTIRFCMIILIMNPEEFYLEHKIRDSQISLFFSQKN